MSESCPQCGREFLREDTGQVKLGDKPEEAIDYCSTSKFSENGHAVYWHSGEQLGEEVPEP